MSKAAKREHPDRQILEGVGSKTGVKSSKKRAPRSADTRVGWLKTQGSKTAKIERPDRQILVVICSKAGGNNGNLGEASGSDSSRGKHRLSPIDPR